MLVGLWDRRHLVKGQQPEPVSGQTDASKLGGSVTLIRAVDESHAGWIDNGIALYQRVDEPVALSYGSSTTIFINWETAVNDLSCEYRPKVGHVVRKRRRRLSQLEFLPVLRRFAPQRTL
jgi:hypothetical protein